MLGKIYLVPPEQSFQKILKMKYCRLIEDEYWRFLLLAGQTSPWVWLSHLQKLSSPREELNQVIRKRNWQIQIDDDVGEEEKNNNDDDLDVQL